MQLEDFLNKLKMIKGLLQLKIMMLNIQHEYADLVSEDFESSDDSYSPACKVHNYTDLMPCPFTGPKMFCPVPNFLSQPKNLTAFSSSSKTFVPAQKAILLNANHHTGWCPFFGVIPP